MTSDAEPLLASLGLFIIDDNVYPVSWNRPKEQNIIGGGVLYAVVGGRIACGKNLGNRITGIIDKGGDFPTNVQDQLDSWGTGIVYRYDANRKTTRGTNVYQEDGARNFVYLSPKKRIEASDIISTGNLVTLKSFHLCCAIDRCKQIIDTICKKREQIAWGRPRFIFEPFPDICVPENYADLKHILHQVDIFSPNLKEAASFLNEKAPDDVAGIAKLARAFFVNSSPENAVVLRCGELGCFIKTKSLEIMLPPYHTNQSNVVDVTGGGNTFCGAYATTLELSNDHLLAGILGNIASGCVIEKLGVPVRTSNSEIWNGKDIKERLQHYFKANQGILGEYDANKIEWLQ